MNPFFCRAFQCCFAVGARFLPWRTPEVYSGSGSLLRVADILKKEGLRRPFVVGPPPPRAGPPRPHTAAFSAICRHRIQAPDCSGRELVFSLET